MCCWTFATSCSSLSPSTFTPHGQWTTFIRHLLVGYLDDIARSSAGRAGCPDGAPRTPGAAVRLPDEPGPVDLLGGCRRERNVLVAGMLERRVGLAAGEQPCLCRDSPSRGLPSGERSAPVGATRPTGSRLSRRRGPQAARRRGR